MHVARHLRRVDGGRSGSPSASSSCTTTATEVVGRRRALPLEPAVLLAAAGVRRTGDPGRDRRASPGCCGCPRVVRGARVRPRGRATRSRAWRSRGSCSGPRYRVGLQGPRAASRALRARTKSYALRARTRRRRRGDAVPVRRGARAPATRSERLSDDGTRTARRSSATSSPSCASRQARKPVGEFLGEVDPAHRHSSTELDADRDRSRRRAARRNLAAFLDAGARVRAGRGRAHAPRVPRLRRRGRGARQAGVGAGPAHRTRTPSKVMTIHAAKGSSSTTCSCPGGAKGLLPSPRSSRTRPSAAKSLDFELRGDAEILPAFDGVLSHFKARAAGAGEYEERRTAYVALTRARKRDSSSAARTGTARTSSAKEAGEFLEELAAWGHGRARHGRCGSRRGRSTRSNPCSGIASGSCGLARAGAARRARTHVFPTGGGHAARRRGRDRRRAADAARTARSGGARAVRGARRRAAAPRRAPAEREAPMP